VTSTHGKHLVAFAQLLDPAHEHPPARGEQAPKAQQSRSPRTTSPSSPAPASVHDRPGVAEDNKPPASAQGAERAERQRSAEPVEHDIHTLAVHQVAYSREEVLVAVVDEPRAKPLDRRRGRAPKLSRTCEAPPPRRARGRRCPPCLPRRARAVSRRFFPWPCGAAAGRRSYAYRPGSRRPPGRDHRAPRPQSPPEHTPAPRPRPTPSARRYGLPRAVSNSPVRALDNSDLSGRERRRLRHTEIRTGAEHGVCLRHAGRQDPDANLARTRSRNLVIDHAHDQSRFRDKQPASAYAVRDESWARTLRPPPSPRSRVSSRASPSCGIKVEWCGLKPLVQPNVRGGSIKISSNISFMVKPSLTWGERAALTADRKEPSLRAQPLVLAPCARRRDLPRQTRGGGRSRSRLPAAPRRLRVPLAGHVPALVNIADLPVGAWHRGRTC
jgi:hypothetical protein